MLNHVKLNIDHNISNSGFTSFTVIAMKFAEKMYLPRRQNKLLRVVAYHSLSLSLLMTVDLNVLCFSQFWVTGENLNFYWI